MIYSVRTVADVAVSLYFDRYASTCTGGGSVLVGAGSGRRRAVGFRCFDGGCREVGSARVGCLGLVCFVGL